MHSGAGTVGWVAPEQIRKAAPLVGPPTDLYALGCIAYRVISGKEVFEGNAQDVLRAHKRTPPPAMNMRPEFPAGAETFVLKLLAKKPWERYEYAADARRAWAELRPREVPPLEEVVAARKPAAVARTGATAAGRPCEQRDEVRHHVPRLRQLAIRGRGQVDVRACPEARHAL